MNVSLVFTFLPLLLMLLSARGEAFGNVNSGSIPFQETDEELHTRRTEWTYQDSSDDQSSWTSKISSEDSQGCDLSRALWDPSCPLYSSFHDDYGHSYDSGSYDGYSGYGSSTDSSSSWGD